jgi:hypothetical protein
VDVAGVAVVAAAGVRRPIKCQLPPRSPSPRRQGCLSVGRDPAVAAPLAVLVRASPGNRRTRTNRAPLRQHRRDAAAEQLAAEEARLEPAVERRHRWLSLRLRLVRVWPLHRQGLVLWLVQKWCQSDLSAAPDLSRIMDVSPVRGPMIAFFFFSSTGIFPSLFWCTEA